MRYQNIHIYLLCSTVICAGAIAHGRTACAQSLDVSPRRPSVEIFSLGDNTSPMQSRQFSRKLNAPILIPPKLTAPVLTPSLAQTTGRSIDPSVELYPLDLPPPPRIERLPLYNAPAVLSRATPVVGDVRMPSDTAAMPVPLIHASKTAAPIAESADLDNPYNYNQISDDILPLPSMPLASQDENAPVNFEADEMNHNDQTGIVTASGSVKIQQSARVITADTVSYNIGKDAVQARGNVILSDESGDVFYADSAELQDNQSNAYVEGVHAALADGSQFTAANGRRINNNKIVMHDASYTPCRPCDEELISAAPAIDGATEKINNDDYTPTWQLTAAEAVHDKDAREMRYRDARFEVYGVPILYAPYFFHPDGSIDRKSGFLSPEAGYKSRLGVFVDSQYYYDIAPEQDATVGFMAMTNEAPLLHGEWRRRWENAAFSIEGGATYATRNDNIAGENVVTDDEWRGHVLADGLWNMNDKWRSGVSIEYASDDQYLRQYDFLDEDILESQIYTERFTTRNYAAARLLTFTDTRVDDEREEQPEVLPEIIASFKGEPNAVPIIGGRWGVDTSFLGLEREGSGSDMNRLSVSGHWQRRLVSDYGVTSDITASVLGDTYNIRDRENNTQSNTNESRLVPTLHVKTAYPMIKPINDSVHAVLEPIGALTLTPNLNENSAIPNEDSQDVQIGADNLFNASRFPGLDKVEDRSRITYGVRGGLYGDNGNQITSFLGQSYRFNDDENIFPAGSGLENQASDIVGQIAGVYDGRYNLHYNMQLDSNQLQSRRHEVTAGAAWDRLSLSTQYLFAKGLADTDLTETREQLSLNAGYYLAPSWRVQTSATHDLGVDAGLRQARLGLDHFGQCVSWSLSAERNLTDDSSGESDTEVYFRIGLKNLGEFEDSGLKIGCDAKG